MTVSTAATNASRTREQVRDVLRAVEEKEKGNPNADRFLNGQASDPGVPEAAAAPVSGSHKVNEDKIIRPNGEAYHVRKIDEHHDVAVLRKCREKSIFPILKGPPGTGKTALVEAAFGRLYTVQGTGDTIVDDFIGGWVPDPTVAGGYRYELGPLTKAADTGTPLYVDEIAQIDPRVTAILYPFMDGRGRLDTTLVPGRTEIVAQPGFFILGAYNPRVAGARLSDALNTRFTMKIHVGTDYELAKTLGVNAKVVRAAKNMATKVASNEANWAPQLRELLAYRDIEEEFGEQTALRNLLGQSPEGTKDRKTFASVLQTEVGRGFVELKVT